MSELPQNVIENPIDYLNKGKFKNLFIFGEDPIGCAVNKKEVKVSPKVIKEQIKNTIRLKKEIIAELKQEIEEYEEQLKRIKK